MQPTDLFDIFLMTAPGLEQALATEVRGKGFKRPQALPGGVLIKGAWPDVWRANLWLRGAGRVLARVDHFHVLHLAQLDTLARRVPWGRFLRPDISFRVEASCKKSRLYHSGAVAERIAKAITETLGAPYAPDDGDILIKARLERDTCTLSLDTSGEALHKRGYKEAVNQAPMRETMASLFLQQCGYTGHEPVYDPMCGSGTFVIEAAEIAARLNPGRLRAFAFEKLATFDSEAWNKMRAVDRSLQPDVRFYGSDRDAGAIAISAANAKRAGVAAYTDFRCCAVSDIVPPPGPPGLVIVNPPYGTRLGDKKKLSPLYRALGQTLRERFSGWRAAIITTEASLAHASGLPFLPTEAPVQHGGLAVTLFQTKAL